MTSLLQPFSGFEDLDAIATTPFACRTVIDQEDSHDSECLTDILGGNLG